MPTLRPFLWFPGNMSDAVDVYTTVFREARLLNRGPMTATLEIFGQRLDMLNAPHQYPFTEAMSLFVECDTQDEVDYYWSALTANGGQEQMCGWLKDRFGVSWQVIPRALGRYLSDGDRAKVDRVAQAMLRMRKIDIAQLDQAYAG